MLIKTHLVICLFFVLLFLPYVNHKILFFIISLFMTTFPDIDYSFSSVGKIKVSKPIKFFTKHRGIIHSLTIAFIFSIILAFFWPFNLISFPFFLGYSIHIFADSFTIEGIEPFWPFKIRVKGKIRTGGILEKIIFYVFSIVDIFMFIFFVIGYFS